MSENEFGKKLTNQNGGPNAGDLTAIVLRRDRRRMWLLGIGCVITWMLVVMLPWTTVLPMLGNVVGHLAEITQNPTTNPADQREQWIRVLQIVKKGTLATFAGSVLSMLAAAICTVSFIVVSRRATLRQMNAALADISAQLRQLKRP